MGDWETSAATFYQEAQPLPIAIYACPVDRYSIARLLKADLEQK
jgi:hypothetical protein